jgi:ribosomal protein L14E/L6E/L27E
MDLKRGDVVRSLAGHDRGQLFCVTETDGDFLLLADGKGRKLNSPKRKRRKHVQRAGPSDHPVFLRLRSGEPVGDNEVRKALAAVRQEREQQQSRRE